MYFELRYYYISNSKYTISGNIARWMNNITSVFGETDTY